MTLDIRIAQPLEFYRKFLTLDARPDGRELGEFRRTTLKLRPIQATTDGSALVKLGNTTVLCGVKAELMEPQPDDDPDVGRVIPNVELGSMCSPSFKPGPPTEQAQVLTQMMADVMFSTTFLDVHKLCIQPGKLVWVLYCDIMCLNYDGNLLDACLVALMAALRVTTLPSVTMNRDTKEILVSDTERKTVTVVDVPVSTTFTIFDGSIVLADANKEEEDLTGEGQIVVVTNAEHVLAVHKPGGLAVPQTKIQTCIERAFQRTKEVHKLIDDEIKAVP